VVASHRQRVTSDKNICDSKRSKGPSLYLGAEDDTEELNRRLDLIRAELGFSWGDLADLHLVSLASRDAQLGIFDKAAQKITPTQLCGKLERRIKEIGAVACFIDTSADAFGGDEINRHQVRQFKPSGASGSFSG
jgi:RecA-family ATPase